MSKAGEKRQNAPERGAMSDYRAKRVKINRVGPNKGGRHRDCQTIPLEDVVKV